MWQTVAQVTSGLTLVAFAFAAIVTILRNRLLARERQLRSTPPADRAALVQALNDTFIIPSLPVDPATLPPGDAYNLLLEQIHDRARRFYATAVLVAFLAVVAAVVAIIAIRQKIEQKPEPPATSGVVNDDGMTLEPNIDYFGGDYRMISPTDEKTCRQSCLQDERCAAYTYDGNPQSGAYRNCYLKAVALNPTPKAGDISGVKRLKKPA